ncbi:MAG: O-antigen ligase family protein [Thermoguttaceae bacterium]|nr:O-antigen ligase family protein [Thermoguttaceae bacterium]
MTERRTRPIESFAGSVVGPGALDERLRFVVDGALAGTLFVVPALMGGRQALGQWALVTLAVAAGMAWAVRQGLRRRPAWRPCPGLVVLGAAIALVIVQWLPLGPSAVARLSPHVPEILPLWNAPIDQPASLGPWARLSLAPAATKAGLIVLIAYALLFFVTVQRIKTLDDLERVLRWCGTAAVAMAIFGLVQYFAGNGRFYWFYEHPYSDTLDVVKGSFTNRNHFAHFLALGIGPLIGWVQSVHHRKTRRDAPGEWTEADDARNRLRLGLLAAAIGVVLLAGLLSLSKGGIVAIVAAAVVATAVAWRASALGGRYVIALAGAGMLLVALATLAAFDRLPERLGALSSGSLDAMDKNHARRNIWAAVARAIPQFAVLGAGVGSHREVYPMFFDAPLESRTEFTHAENSYLQLGLETGAAGLVLAATGMGLCAAWCIGTLRRAMSSRAFVAAGAIAASLAASAIHAAVDFVWYVPGCMVMVVILAAAAFGCRQLAGDATARAVHARPLARAAAWGFAAALGVVGVWMIGDRIGPVLAEPAWHRYLIARKPVGASSSARSLDAEEGDPLARRDHADANRAAAARQRLAELEEVVRWSPDHARARLELAEASLRLFDLCQMGAENSMSLCDVRDAVFASRFPSREALEAWLARAVGEHWGLLRKAIDQTRHALRLCPLQGRGYLFLAELCFLEGEGDRAKNAYLAQAVRVRPYDGDIHLAVAQQALRAGDTAGWLEHLHRAYQAGRPYQQRLIRDLIAATPVQGLGAMIGFLIDEFHPNVDGLRAMYHAATEFERAERFAMLAPADRPAALGEVRAQLAPLRAGLARWAETEAATRSGTEAARLWLDAARCYRELADARAADCARRAVRCDPNQYDARHEAALCLIDARELAEAEPHVQWCLQRRPDDRTLVRRFQEALRESLDAAGSETAGQALGTGRDRR